MGAYIQNGLLSALSQRRSSRNLMLRDGWSTEWKLLKPSHSFLLLLLLK
jgi:hypothetical protein